MGAPLGRPMVAGNIVISPVVSEEQERIVQLLIVSNDGARIVANLTVEDVTVLSAMALDAATGPSLHQRRMMLGMGVLG